MSIVSTPFLSPPSRAQGEWSQIAFYFSVPRNLYDAEAVMVDLDGDDYMDLVMAGFPQLPTFENLSPNSTAGIYIHQTDLPKPADPTADTVRSFRRVQIAEFETMSHPAIAVADYDNDGRPDVAASGIQDGDGRALLIQQTGNLEFTWNDGAFRAVSGGSLHWGDYDNDGREDLLVTGNSFDRAITRVYQNQGGGLIQDAEVDLPPVTQGSARWGDSDNDGDLDVLITGAANGEAFYSGLFLNDDGEFVNAQADLPDLAFSKARWADLNNDGLLDIVLAGALQSPFIAEGKVYTLLNQGDNEFRNVPNDVEGFYDGDLEIADLNGDGSLDIAVSGYMHALYSSSPARFYEFTDDGLEELGTVFHAIDMSFAPGDFDRDGDVDWFLTGFNPESAGMETPTAAFYSNKNQPENVPPTPPAQLSADVSGRSVQFSWERATDEATPSAGLTYALRVGSAPGRVDVMSSMSSPASGLRYVCRQGNVFHNTSWTLHDLPPGTYYWSVQSVDNRCGGSTFAPEGTFTITGTGTGTEKASDSVSRLQLHPAHPNPFYDQTRISYEVARDARVDVVVYDMLGREVRKLISGASARGRGAVTWDGRDESGAALAPGLYGFRISAGGQIESGTVLLVR